MAKASTKKYVAGLLICLALFTVTVVWMHGPQFRLQWAPDVVLQLIDGRRIDLRNRSGNPLLLIFWATTCEICVKKTPELKALYQAMKPRGLELVAVAMSYDPPNRILTFSKDNDIPYPIALDMDGSVAKAFNDVSLTPTTFLIGADGKIVLSKTGNFAIEDLKEKISELLLVEKPRAPKETS